VTERGRQPRYGHLPNLWIGEGGKGALTKNGLYQAVMRRLGDAGLGHLSPHAFRRGTATNGLRAGMQESLLMQLMGWDTRAMVEHSTATQRNELAVKGTANSTRQVGSPSR
jgi:integrase/recombinase XerC